MTHRFLAIDIPGLIEDEHESHVRFRWHGPHVRQQNRPKAISSSVYRYDEGEQERDRSIRGRIRGSTNTDAGENSDAVRRAEDTESLELRQQAARPIRLRQMWPFLQEEGLAATPRTLGMRQRAAVQVPVLPATLQAQGTLAASHMSQTSR